MTRWYLQPTAKLSGSITLPGSKSQSLRALLFAALAIGPSELFGLIDSPDARAMRGALEKLGATFSEMGRSLLVEPIHDLAATSSSTQLIEAGNSGIVWRFMAAIASLTGSLSLVVGDRSLLYRRPMQPLLKALASCGVKGWQTQGLLGGPTIIQGPWRRLDLGESEYQLVVDGRDSQPVSALLIAASLQKAPTSIRVENPAEIPWVQLTVHWLRFLGLDIKAADDGTFYSVQPGHWNGLHYKIPADFSSAAFLIAACAITQSKIELKGLSRDDPQPDRELIQVLGQAGLIFEWSGHSLFIDGSEGYSGFDLDLEGPIDLLPIAAVLGCYAKTPTLLRSITGARSKECDRVEAIGLELKKMGAHLSVEGDSMIIHPQPLKGALLSSHSDHRLAMALAVAALGAKGSSQIEGSEWAVKTYGAFAQDLRTLGVDIQEGT